MRNNTATFSVLRFVAIICATAGLWCSQGANTATAEEPAVEQEPPPVFRERFLALCDRACDRLNQPDRRAQFYQDAYVVRALAVAFDETGRQKYLDVCKAWSDRMLDYQQGMSPAGAYYMHYGRKPGEKTGSWYVADSGCIGMGVVATAARCSDPTIRSRYLDSAERFARLVRDNYVGSSGGVKNGAWPKFDGEWWCSTAAFAAFEFALYAETSRPEHLRTGLKAIEWLNAIDIQTTKPYPLSDQGPSMIMYIAEAYSAAWPFLDDSDGLRARARQQNASLLAWASQHQAGRSGPGRWDYHSQWGSKYGGLPLHAYVSGRLTGADPRLTADADRELKHLTRIIAEKPQREFAQLEAFTLVSYAERVRPGGLYRSGGSATASRRSD